MVAEDAPSSRNLLESKQKTSGWSLFGFSQAKCLKAHPLPGGPGLAAASSRTSLNRRTRFGSGRWPSGALLTDDRLRPISQLLVEAVPSGSRAWKRRGPCCASLLSSAWLPMQPSRR
jgi:hypothetical protein